MVSALHLVRFCRPGAEARAPVCRRMARRPERAGERVLRARGYWSRWPLARIAPSPLTSIFEVSVSGPSPGRAKRPSIMRAAIA